METLENFSSSVLVSEVITIIRMSQSAELESV